MSTTPAQARDFHADGLTWALADSMQSQRMDDWTADDIARAFEAGAKLAMALAAPEAAPAVHAPIDVEAVAEVVDTEEGLELRWLIEGGVAALAEGLVLVAPHQPITDEFGHGQVHAAPTAQPEAPAQDAQPDSSAVICPQCSHQFRAIPMNVQRLMLDAGFEPPFTAQPARAVPPGYPVHLSSAQRTPNHPRFSVFDGGVMDDDFIFDAMLRITGDFPDEATRIAYSQMVADLLNAPDAAARPQADPTT